MDARTAAHTINNVCNLYSRFIHCEICVLPIGKSVFITRQSQVVCFEPRVYDRNLWSFIWVHLTAEKYALFEHKLEDMLNEQMPFSAMNVYCFPFYSSPCYCQCLPPSSTNCAITTMQIIKTLWGANAVGSKADYEFTPSDIYALLRYRLSYSTDLVFDNQLTEENQPPMFLLPKDGPEASATLANTANPEDEYASRPIQRKTKKKNKNVLF
jgi:hypothetical protein